MNTPFLTALAPGAAVRGSLDPLGLTAIWSRLGRRLVRNVSTVSGDLRGWTTLLLSTHIARRLVEEGARPEADFTDMLLRFEQVVAYARHMHDPDAEGVRGILGVRRRVAQSGGRPIPLGQGDDARILTNQRATGVWGQIAGPAAESRLLDSRNLRLESAAADEVQKLYGAQLGKHDRSIRELLVERRPLDRRGRHAGLLSILAAMHRPALTEDEQPFYRDYVLYAAQGPESAQARLVRLWWNSGRIAHGVNATEVAALADRADVTEVREGLQAIRRAESLLAPADHLFAFLLGRHAQHLDDVLKEIDARWNLPLAEIDPLAVDFVTPQMQDAYGAGAPVDTMHSLLDALRAGAWGDAIMALMALNAWVSDYRQGAPWLTLSNGRFEVRIEAEPGDLPTNARLQWEHSYYLEPLRRLIVAVEGGRHVA